MNFYNLKNNLTDDLIDFITKCEEEERNFEEELEECIEDAKMEM